MRRQSTTRAAVALVAALAASAVTGCSSAPQPDLPTQLPQAALQSILRTCYQSSGLQGAAQFQLRNGAVTVSEPGGSPDPDSPLTQLSTCLAGYPVDGGYVNVPRPAYLLMVLDYEEHVLTPCLEAQGYRVQPPPTRADYLSGIYWTAYQSVELDDLGQWEALARICPPKPAFLRGGY